jgi:hypothetical protein
MSTSAKYVYVLFITLFVAGCGGGKDLFEDLFDKKEPVKVTKENAKQVARAGLRVFDVGDAGTFGAVVALVLVNGGAIASGEQSATCQQFYNSTNSSGNVVTKLTDADGNARFSRGDSASLTFSDCVEPSKKIKLSGSMKISFDPEICNGVPGAPQWTHGGILEITELKGVATAGNKTDNRTYKGSITFCAQATSATALTEQHKTSEFSVQTSNDTLKLTDVSISATTDLATTAYSHSAVAAMSSDSLKGSFRINTGAFFGTNAKVFVGIGSEFPRDGELEVSAGSSKVRISAVDNTNVILSTDLDGDQVFESTETVTWESLL